METGTWLSRDPAGFVDGPNLYADVQQNPWTSYDPDGLLAFQVHNPHAGWNPDIRAITSSPEYQKAYWETAQTGALALAAAPLVVAAAYSGPAVAAVIAKEAASEAASAGFEAATGLPAPPISVKDIGEKIVKEGSKKVVKESGDKIVKETTHEMLYRGVPGNGTEKAALAKLGVVKPRGTAIDPITLRKHVMGEDVASGVTSWSPERNVAKRFSGTDGTIVEVPRIQVEDKIVSRPPVQKFEGEKEVLEKGTVEGKPTKP